MVKRKHLVNAPLSMEAAVTTTTARQGLYAKVSPKWKSMQLYESSAFIVLLLLSLDSTFEPDECTHGEIKLVGGNGDHEGTVHVCINQVWSTICDFGWSSADAGVVCQQLGYQRGGKSCALVLCSVSTVLTTAHLFNERIAMKSIAIFMLL